MLNYQRVIPPEVVIAVAFLGRATGHGWMTMPPARNAVAGEKNGLGTRYNCITQEW